MLPTLNNRQIQKILQVLEETLDMTMASVIELVNQACNALHTLVTAAANAILLALARVLATAAL